MSDYRPGDVVNGHVLGEDNQWHPVPALGIAKQIPQRTYRERYADRWKWTVLIVGVLLAISGIQDETWGGGAQVSTSLVDLAVRLLVGGLIFGAVVNLAVAAIPGQRRTSD